MRCKPAYSSPGGRDATPLGGAGAATHPAPGKGFPLTPPLEKEQSAREISHGKGSTSRGLVQERRVYGGYRMQRERRCCFHRPFSRSDRRRAEGSARTGSSTHQYGTCAPRDCKRADSSEIIFHRSRGRRVRHTVNVLRKLRGQPRCAPAPETHPSRPSRSAAARAHAAHASTLPLRLRAGLCVRSAVVLAVWEHKSVPRSATTRTL